MSERYLAEARAAWHDLSWRFVARRGAYACYSEAIEDDEKLQFPSDVVAKAAPNGPGRVCQ
jgi:hypothetical protein